MLNEINKEHAQRELKCGIEIKMKKGNLRLRKN